MLESDNLNTLLDQWKVTPSVQTDFSAKVQQRLREQPQTNLLARVIAFPATLPLAAGLAVWLGISAALTLDQARDQDQLATAYARSIDPFQMASPHDH